MYTATSYGLGRWPNCRFRAKGTALAAPFDYLPLVMVSRRAVVTACPHTALLETGDRSRKGKDRSCPVSRRALYRHARRGKPRLTSVSDGNPLRRLLLGSWKKVAVHGSLSFQMDLPVTSRKASRFLHSNSTCDPGGRNLANNWRAPPGTTVFLLELTPQIWVRFGSNKRRIPYNTVVYRAGLSKKNHPHSILALVSGTSRPRAACLRGLVPSAVQGASGGDSLGCRHLCTTGPRRHLT